ncbi:hypothetical protein GCM10011335_42190 [Aureimonas glaciei]|uniref:Transposase n=1 Tax=Aureimonas glaciei TaxID=1776957 RepID=A0A917DFU2_9HYPH|nr:hypothetical protein GCM10011335_42190 [Aureimonas glaciei]
MKRSRFSEEQIIGILKEHEAGAPVAELCRKHGVSDASVYKWKAKYGGMDVSEARRLRAIEDENAKPKRMLADAMLDDVALKDFLGSGDAPARRTAVAPLVQRHERSDGERTQIHRQLPHDVRYQSTRPQDEVLRERMVAPAPGAPARWIPAPARFAEAGGIRRQSSITRSSSVSTAKSDWLWAAAAVASRRSGPGADPGAPGARQALVAGLCL